MTKEKQLEVGMKFTMAGKVCEVSKVKGTMLVYTTKDKAGREIGAYTMSREHENKILAQQ